MEGATTSAVAATGLGSTALSTAKAVMISPIFGVALLVGIIGFELWKGSRDAQKLKEAKQAN